jgi:type IV secretory pathway VirB10-like protein
LVEPSQKEIEIATSEQITESYGDEFEKNPSHLSHPAPISIPAVTNPSPNPSHSSHSAPISVPAVTNPSPNPSHSSHSAPISVPAVTNPSPNPSQPATSDDELKGWGEYHQRKPYPNPKSDNVRSSQKRSLAIRQAYRAARTKEDLSALHRELGGKFSEDELNWVYNWLKIFFKAEHSHVQMTAKVSQPGLL